MPTLRDQAICIRQWDYSETSQTVSLFLREHGMIRGLAKGARREQGRFSGGIDLLTRGEIVAITKPDRDLATLTEWDLQEVYWGLRLSLERARTGYYMADLVQHFFTDSSPHAAIFDGLHTGLSALQSSDAPTVLLTFQWLVLSEAGYRPRLDIPGGDAHASNLGFSPLSGMLIAMDAAPVAWRVRRSTVDLLRSLDTAPGAAPEPAPPARPAAGDLESIVRANRFLAAYIREVLHREPPTMRLLFPELDGTAHNRQKISNHG